MAFFNSPEQLASLFTAPNNHNPETQGKYLEGGMKPIEAFCNDIFNDLVEWSYAKESVFYKTQHYWYEIRLVTEGEWAGAVVMTRYNNHSWTRLDSWANKHSVESLGKVWLETPANQRKFVPLFNEEIG